MGVCVCSLAQSCSTLCDPTDCSLPGSSVHGISQARILEWVAISFSRGIFPTQGWNPHLPHWQADSFPMSHLGSPGFRQNIPPRQKCDLSFYMFLFPLILVLVSAPSTCLVCSFRTHVNGSRLGVLWGPVEQTSPYSNLLDHEWSCPRDTLHGVPVYPGAKSFLRTFFF